VEGGKVKAHRILADNKRQVSEDRRQVTDAGTEIAWIVHSCNSLEPLTPSIERCLSLCAMPFLLATRNPHPATNQSSSGVKVTTSSISVASQNSITRRSIPSAMPAAAGMSFKAFKNFSGIG